MKNIQSFLKVRLSARTSFVLIFIILLISVIFISFYYNTFFDVSNIDNKDKLNTSTVFSKDQIRYSDNEILVKFNPSAFEKNDFTSQTQQFNQSHSSKLEAVFNEKTLINQRSFKNNGLDRIFKVKRKSNQGIEELINTYKKSDLIEYVEPNYIFQSNIIPNDKKYNLQWYLPKINAPQAWEIETGDPTISIAVIDTGVDWNHPDLEANTWLNPQDPWADPNNPDSGDSQDSDVNGFIDDYKGWDFVHIEDSRLRSYCQNQGDDCVIRDNNPMDFYGHGTHVAGIAAAVSNNNIGVVGEAWYVKILNVRAGAAGFLEIDDIMAAALYAVDMEADIINASWGSSRESYGIRDVINYARDNEVIWVASAGNSYSEKSGYPAVHNGVISVAATNSTDQITSFSSYGSSIDIAAPGQNIYSTMFDNTYTYKSGTSMAAPSVAGIAALLKSEHPTWSYEKLFARTKNRADNIDAQNPSYINKLGSGRINAQKVVLSADNIHPDSTLVKVVGDPKVYYLDGGKRHIPNASVFTANFQWEDIVAISDSERNSYINGPSFMYPDGTLLQGSGAAVYVLEYGIRRHVTSSTVFLGLGYKWKKIRTISDGELSRYSQGVNLSSYSTHPSGALVQATGDPAVYLIDNGRKHHIPSLQVFTSMYRWSDICSISTTERNAYPTGSNVKFPDGTLIMASGPKVYVIEYGDKRHIVSSRVFNNLGYNWSNIKMISNSELDNYPTGPDIN